VPVSLFSAAARRLPAHATVPGKALLAFSWPDMTNLVISCSLPGYTAGTPTRPDQLHYVLHQTRRNGFATVDRPPGRGPTPRRVTHTPGAAVTRHPPSVAYYS
jgi:DNA-binding IclR family transcriptional regulator